MHISVIPYLPEFLSFWGWCGLFDLSNRSSSPEVNSSSLCLADTSGGEWGATSQLLYHSVQNISQFFSFPTATILLPFKFCTYLLWKISQCLKKQWEILARGLVRMQIPSALQGKCSYRSVNVFLSSTICSEGVVSWAKAPRSLLLIGARISLEKIKQWITV